MEAVRQVLAHGWRGTLTDRADHVANVDVAPGTVVGESDQQRPSLVSTDHRRKLVAVMSLARNGRGRPFRRSRRAAR